MEKDVYKRAENEGYKCALQPLITFQACEILCFSGSCKNKPHLECVGSPRKTLTSQELKLKNKISLNLIDHVSSRTNREYTSLFKSQKKQRTHTSLLSSPPL